MLRNFSNKNQKNRYSKRENLALEQLETRTLMSGVPFGESLAVETPTVEMVAPALDSEQVIMNDSEVENETSICETSAESPLNVSLEVTSKKITANWNAVDGAESYIVHYSIAGTNRMMTKTVKGTEFSFYAKAGITYDVSVTALDASKSSICSASIQSVTAPETLSRLHLKVDSQSVTDESFSINVSGMANNATHLKITIGEESANISLDGESVTLGSVSCEYKDGVLIFQNAKSNTKYQIQVSQVVMDGTTVMNASDTMWVNAKTMLTNWNIPTDVQAKIDGTTAVVSWTAAQGKNSTTEADMYTVQYAIQGSGLWKTATFNATGTSFEVTNLQEGQDYEFRICANKTKDFNASDFTVAETSIDDEPLPVAKSELETLKAKIKAGQRAQASLKGRGLKNSEAYKEVGRQLRDLTAQYNRLLKQNRTTTSSSKVTLTIVKKK